MSACVFIYLYPAVDCWFLPQLRWDPSPLPGRFTCYVHKMVLLSCHSGAAAVPAVVAATKRKQAHIIITISANCSDGSVTASVHTLHIVSIIPNCCSRPCHRKMLKILHVWSCGLLWNWKWMVINYNDDHRGERFCATGCFTACAEKAEKNL